MEFNTLSPGPLSSASSSAAGGSPPGRQAAAQELQRIAAQLQAEIDALREFSELERAFLESQVAEGEARSAELQCRLDATTVAQETAAQAPVASDENTNLTNQVRKLKVELWKANLTAKQNASGLDWYRNGAISAAVAHSGAAVNDLHREHEGSSSSSPGSRGCVGSATSTTGAADALSKEAIASASRKIAILQ